MDNGASIISSIIWHSCSVQCHHFSTKFMCVRMLSKKKY